MIDVAQICRLVKGVFLVTLAMQFLSCSEEPENDDEPGLYGTFTDTLDGTVYRTLRLGDQIWLAGNIDRGEMVDGSTGQQDNGIIEKYCYNNEPVLCEKYGGLYQWGEAMQYSTVESSQGICPTGWHIPSDSEWMILEAFLGMTGEDTVKELWRGNEQGVALQPEGETGFEALMGGNRFVTGTFSQIGSTGYFWTSTSAEDGHAWRRGVDAGQNGIYRSKNDKSFGFSVRCVRY